MADNLWPGPRGMATRAARPPHQEVMWGRAAEEEIVRDLLRRTQQGRGGVVLVEGEPGTGKSLLLREAINEAARLGFWPAAGAADPLGRAIPFFTLRAALPELFACLNVNHHEPSEVSSWWISQLHAHLAQRAAVTPVLVCLDDVQWACPATLAALLSLPQGLKFHRIAWIFARCATADRDAEHLFNLLEKDGADRVSLTSLGDEAVSGLLAEAFGAPPDQGLLDLATGAGGNPALLAELVRGLADDNAVGVTGDCSVLVSARLPERMRRFAQRRIADLSKQARHLLTTAAVLGCSFRLEDAAEMLGATPAALLPAVEEVIGAGLVVAADNAFSFRHRLLSRAVSDTVPPPARKALHRQYSQILLDRGLPAAVAASHLLQAASPCHPASLTDLDTAAAQSMQSAPQTAVELALRALELTPPEAQGALPRTVAAAEALAAAGRFDQAARTARETLVKPLPPVAEARLRCVLASVSHARGQLSDALAEARLAVAQPRLPDKVRDRVAAGYLQALAGRHDELAGPVADAILGDPDQHESHAVVAALVARAAASWNDGQVDEGLELLRDAARHGAGISPDARDAQPLLALAAALADLRQLDEVEQILRIADGQPLRGIPAEATLLVLRARISLYRGRIPDAAAAGLAALAAAETLGAHGYASAAHCVLGVIALRRGDIVAAAHHVSHGQHPHAADLYARAETALALAQVSEARNGQAAVLDRIGEICVDLQAHGGLLLGDPATAAWLTRVALAAGDSEVAAATARAADALASANPGYPAITAAAAHSLGLVGQDPGRLADAAVQHPDPWAKASAAEDLGVLYASRGDQDEAIRQLTEAILGYQLTGASADKARVRSRLRHLGVRRRHWTQSAGRPVTGWESLTGSERAVSELVAQGLSNRQVANQLYISVNTVSFNLKQVFRKLGVSSRVELARLHVHDDR